MRRKSVQRQSFAARGEKKKKVKKLKDIEPEVIPEEIEEKPEETKRITVQEKISNPNNTVRPISPGKIGALDEPEKAPAGNRGTMNFVAVLYN